MKNQTLIKTTIHLVNHTLNEMLFNKNDLKTKKKLHVFKIKSNFIFETSNLKNKNNPQSIFFN